MSKVALVLEGGAMRGMFTAGVLDVLLENNIQVDGIIGASAGALFGVNYFSKQKGRVIRYSKKYCKNIRYISIISLLFTGNLVNKNFAYYKVPTKLDKFDNDEFVKNNKGYYAVVTNIETGKPEYLEIKDCIKDIEILRASSSIPLVSKIVNINGKKYLDGAMADSIPIKKCLELGYDKIIVVLTRPQNYKKASISLKMKYILEKKYKHYPKFVKTIVNRPKNYNKNINYIKNLEKNKKIYVIRPSEEIITKVIERNKNKLQRVYDLGVINAKKGIDNLKKFLD